MYDATWEISMLPPFSRARFVTLSYTGIRPRPIDNSRLIIFWFGLLRILVRATGFISLHQGPFEARYASLQFIVAQAPFRAGSFNQRFGTSDPFVVRYVERDFTSSEIHYFGGIPFFSPVRPACGWETRDSWDDAWFNKSFFIFILKFIFASSFKIFDTSRVE